MLREVITIKEATQGRQHPETANAISNLAGVLKDKGELDEAEELYGEALEIREATLGRDHPSTATAIGGLAGVLLDKGELDQAEELYGEALAIDVATLGADHQDAVYSRGCTGGPLLLRGGDAATEGRALVMAAMQTLQGPPHSLPDDHRWLKRFRSWLEAAK